MNARTLAALLLLLLALAACRSRAEEEETLRRNLAILRGAIGQYIAEKHVPPASFEDLVTAGYLTMVPTDPITGRQDWLPIACEEPVTTAGAEPGICDVRSASTASSSDGTPYAAW